MSIDDSHRAMTRHILRVYRTATPEQIRSGVEWFDEAFTACEQIAFYTGYTVTQAVVALAHLSPRTRWHWNLRLTEHLLNGGPKPVWALSRQWGIAKTSLQAEDPLATFSRRANKTSHFARGILGDRQSVCVDTWTARAAGAEESSVRSQAGYNTVVNAFRRGAPRVGISPRDLQAVVWVVARGDHR